MSRVVQYAFHFPVLSAFALLWSACSPSASVQRGQKLFDIHCASCHEDPPTYLKKQPPKLEGLFEAKHLPSGAPATDKQVRKTIVGGLRTMPAFDQRLSNRDLDDLVAFLHALK